MKKIKIPLILFLLFTILTNPNKENLESKLINETTFEGYIADEFVISRNNYLFFSTYDCAKFSFTPGHYPQFRNVEVIVKFEYYGFAGKYWSK